MSQTILRNSLAEFVGTYVLVFGGTSAIMVDEISGGAVTHLGIAIAFGLVVMVMIYAIGETSGAHMNPAVTLGFWAAGRFPLADVIPYVAAQILGALAASTTLLFLYGDVARLGGTWPVGSVGQSFVLEIILTFILMFVIITVATGAKEKGIMAGSAIGATVGLLALIGGPISGASMNPARSLGPALIAGDLSDQWLYLVGPVIGALVAIGVYRGIGRGGDGDRRG